MPALTKEQWLELFSLWREHDAARMRVQLREACARRDRLVAQLRKETPRPQPFRCPCGALLADPFAPGVLEFHQPRANL